MPKLTSRGTVDDSIKLEIWWLRRNGFLDTRSKGVITWTIKGWIEKEYDAGFIMRLSDPHNPYMRVVNVQEYLDGNPNPIQYTVRFTKTFCNYGGMRYWFECPFCNKRIAVLYQPDGGNKFGCRSCHNLTYAIRNLNPATRDHPLNAHIIGRRMSKLDDQIHKTRYRGKTTRKQRLYDKLSRKFKSYL